MVGGSESENIRPGRRLTMKATMQLTGAIQLPGIG
jgi:hypothetical protein